MGLHDGRAPDSPVGSTAELAATLKVPVVLVVPAAAMARTAAAVVNGLVDFDPKVRVIGVVFNQIGSPTHLAILEKAMAAYARVPVLGGLPKAAKVALPSRHLGLYMGQDGVLEPTKLAALEKLVAEHVRVEKILLDADIDVHPTNLLSFRPAPWAKRIAVARDKVFCFYYEDNFDVLRRLGYELVFFSPLTDTRLPENASFYYFGGGYPELYAEALSKNLPMRKAVQAASQNNAFIYGECGGLMYLGETLTTADDRTHSMCGCFPCHTAMKNKLQSLGYTEVRLQEDFLFIKQDTQVRGHCFHYSELALDHGAAVRNIYRGEPEGKAVGYRIRNTLASYVHLHFSSLLEEKEDT